MASDLLIIYDNAVDRATASASSTSGTTSANNLKNDIKGKIHRSGYTGSVTYSFTWPVNQTIGALAIPTTNVSPSATLNVVVYSAANYTGSMESSGSVSAFTYSDINNWNSYSGSVTANEFASGRYSSGHIILGSNYPNVRSATVTIAGDTSGTLIDTSRVVLGRSWRPNRYASNGIQFSIDDTATKVRTSSGNVVVDSGFKSDNLSFDIKVMDETDRTELIKILKLVGSSKNVFVSIFPSTANRLKNDYSIYGTINKSPITYEIYGYYTNNVNISGW